MNKKNVILLIMVASILMLFAQNHGNQNRLDAKQIMENLTSRLKLTSEQQKDISPLVDQQMELMKSQRGHGRSQGNADRNKFRESMDKINEQISELLTSDQQKEYETMLKEFHENRRNGPGNRN